MDLLAATITEGRITDPRLQALLDLWQDKRGDRPLPPREAFSWADLKPWMGNLLLLDVLEDGQDFRYRLWGSELSRFLGYELTGRRMSEVVSWLGPNPRDEYRRICASRQPLAVAVRIPDPERPVYLDKVALPLATEVGAVQQILAAIYPASRHG